MGDMLPTLLGLFGGLAIFIFGMNMMSENMQKVAGEKMKDVLALLTKNPVMGVLAGALTTAVLQSSSATTVMAIGFVSARLMGLPQAISIIFGANIGTTITAQIIAFKITDYILAFVFIGFLISFIAKSDRYKSIGLSILGFGLLFLGIETMGDSMKPLASSPVFIDMISQVSDIPVLGVAVGTLMTIIVQSSSATIAVLQNLASQPGADGVSSVIGLTGAIPVLLGDNIGTTITALLASIGQSRNAKRVALSHSLFNISGCLLFIWFIAPYAGFIQMISPAGPEVEVISRQIANAHTCFNITMTLIWLPLIGLMVKIVTTLLPDKANAGGKAVPTGEPMYLDSRLVGQPVVALQMVVQEILRCGEIMHQAIGELSAALGDKDDKRAAAAAESTRAVSEVCGKTTNYLADLFAAGALNEEQATHTAALMGVINDIERVGFLCTEIADSSKGADYSAKARESLRNVTALAGETFEAAMDAANADGDDAMDGVLANADKIDAMTIKMRKAHMKRVERGECSTSLTVSYSRVLSDISRIGNGCVNIAEALSGRLSLKYFLIDDAVLTEAEKQALAAKDRA